MEKNKKLNKFFGYTLLILLMTFATLYISGKAGYYEYTQNRKKIFTEDQIMRFEEDVRAGKVIDIENYLVNQTNFQDRKKRLGLKTSEFIGNYIKLSVNKIFKILNKLVEN